MVEVRQGTLRVDGRDRGPAEEKEEKKKEEEEMGLT